MSYSSHDRDDLFINFYKVVNNIIYDIHMNENISKYLFYCNYINLVNNSKNEYPLTICLGGAGYIHYENIFKDYGLENEKKLKSYDYDISMAIIHFLNKDKKDLIVKEIKKVINKYLTSFKYKNITSSNFKIENISNASRIHIRVNFNSSIKYDKEFHILELSFWLNGKISDNFTVNDFYNKPLYIYNKDNIYYYLLPLELLVKTTLYAIVDFFEKRNFNKCIKYIERVTFVKLIYDQYEQTYEQTNGHNDTLKIILDKYAKLIKRKYKFINDYPFIISYPLSAINNNGIIKCIYQNLRKENRLNIDNQIKTYEEKCDKKKPYDITQSENTIIDTDDEHY